MVAAVELVATHREFPTHYQLILEPKHWGDRPNLGPNLGFDHGDIIIDTHHPAARFGLTLVA